MFQVLWAIKIFFYQNNRNFPLEISFFWIIFLGTFLLDPLTALLELYNHILPYVFSPPGSSG